jgi:hypothetical protein
MCMFLSITIKRFKGFQIGRLLFKPTSRHVWPGWPDWANFRSLGDFFLFGAVFWKLHEQPIFCASFTHW